MYNDGCNEKQNKQQPSFQIFCDSPKKNRQNPLSIQNEISRSFEIYEDKNDSFQGKNLF